MPLLKWLFGLSSMEQDLLADLTQRNQQMRDLEANLEEIVRNKNKKHDELHSENVALRALLQETEVSLEESGTARIRLEDEARQYEQRMSEMVTDLREARRELIDTHRKYADFLALSAGRRTVFEPQPQSELPAIDTRPINTTGKISAKDVVQRYAAQSIQEDRDRQAERSRIFEEEAAQAVERRAEAERKTG